MKNTFSTAQVAVLSSRSININYVGECISNLPCLQNMRKATEKPYQASRSPGQELKIGPS